MFASKTERKYIKKAKKKYPGKQETFIKVKRSNNTVKFAIASYYDMIMSAIKKNDKHSKELSEIKMDKDKIKASAFVDIANDRICYLVLYNDIISASNKGSAFILNMTAKDYNIHFKKDEFVFTVMHTIQPLSCIELVPSGAHMIVPGMALIMWSQHYYDSKQIMSPWMRKKRIWCDYCMTYRCTFRSTKYKKPIQSMDFKLCKGCKFIYYCSKRCQKKGWKEGHRDKCQNFK